MSATNSATTGGFEPGLSGPHVYVVGTTANRNFVNSLVFNASCTTQPLASTPGSVPPLCPVPEVWGSGVTVTGTRPTLPFCDPLQQAAPGQPGYNPVTGSGVCPAGGEALGDLRVKLATGGVNSGQTQGWLVSFQFPAVTQAVVQAPGNASASAVTTLNPPTIPNYIVLQPPTCPPQLATCVQGEVVTTVNSPGSVTTASPAPPLSFGCTFNGINVVCPTPFLAGWSSVAVDSDMQVYAFGQMGMSPGVGGATPALYGTGAPDRLALELERITPYANTPGGSPFYPNYCPGGTNAPCAFPMPDFPFSGVGDATSFVVDAGTGVGGGAGSILNSSFGQILPGAPPYPNPTQPGGLGTGIAVSPSREAFFAGTSTVLTAPVTVGTQATAGAVTLLNGTINTIAVANGGSGYTSAPSCTITGGGGVGATCTTTITPPPQGRVL